MENSKVLTIFAGINGAGKSTLYYALGEENFGVRLNTDEIVMRAGLDWKSLRAQADAGKLLLSIQEQCFAGGVSFNRESTLSGNNILQTIIKAKSLGYQISLYYVGVNSLSIAKKRIEHRVNMGGHGVSDDLLKIRYGKLENNLARIVPLCDKIHFYDNSIDNLQLAAYKSGKEFVKTNYECDWIDKTLHAITNGDRAPEQGTKS